MPEQTLYLARHAHALDDAPTDAARPLSDKGRRQLARLCETLRRSRAIAPDLVWHSGLVRARETAEALAQGLRLDAPISREEGFAPEDDPRASAAKLDALSASCLVAGHEPHLSSLAAILLARDGARGPDVVFDKASILCLSRPAPGAPWQIRWHLSHKLFK